MNLSAEKFKEMIKSFGYVEESDIVYDFLKGNSEFDFQKKEHFFTLRNIYQYRQMMQEKQDGKKFEIDYDFHNFLFKSISSDGQSITDADLDIAINQLNLQQELK